MPTRIQRLPDVGTPDVAADLFHEGDLLSGTPREQTCVILGESFASGVRAGERYAGFRHTHIGWFPLESAMDDPGPARPTWIARIQGLTYRVMLVQTVSRGALPGMKKAWLLRLVSFALEGGAP